MFDYRFTVVAPLSYPEPLAYSMAPRTVPTLVSRFTNPPRWTLQDRPLVDRSQTGHHGRGDRDSVEVCLTSCGQLI
jgi:hypothetical protein